MNTLQGGIGLGQDEGEVGSVGEVLTDHSGNACYTDGHNSQVCIVGSDVQRVCFALNNSNLCLPLHTSQYT